MSTQKTRRDFLRLSGTSVGAAAALALVPPSIRKALAIPAAVQSRTIKDVKHVVILMQENRAFDHYFGTLRGVRGFGDRFPIPLESGKSVWFQSDGTREIPPYHLDSGTTNALLVPDTPHSYSDMQLAWNQGKMGFWPKYKTQFSMGHYQRADIPFQFALAEAFTICDAYHCSVTTGTDPNRIVFWSGSNFDPALRAQGINCQADDSEPNNLRCWITGTWVDGQWPSGYHYAGSAFTWDTIPDVLQREGISWRIYQDMNNNWTGAMNGCNAFATFRNAEPGTPIYENGMSSWSIDDLTSHVMANTLPEVCWILPTQAASEHPGGPSSPTHGGDFTSQVLEALTSNPDVWAKTVLFITFDENDGFFDHLPAPAVPSYNADGTLAGKSTLPLDGEYFYDPNRQAINAADTISGTTRPWGLGPRVPMYVVSPWSKGGWVDSQVFDHTSVARFLEQRFDISIDTISPWHRAVSGDLTTAFDFHSPNDPSFPELPDQSDWAASDAAQRLLPKPVAPATPQPLFQEAGTRYSRALPYELHCNMLRDNDDDEVSLQFGNSGRVGAVFHVYDQLHLDRIPRRYTVEAGKSLSDTWAAESDGSYDLEVHGPNGYFRAFTGNTSTPIVPSISYLPRLRTVLLNIRNSSLRPLHVSVVRNAYRTGHGDSVNLQVLPILGAELPIVVAASGNWYDFSVVIASGTTVFEHRFAGRMETGSDGSSDPEIAID